MGVRVMNKEEFESRLTELKANSHHLVNKPALYTGQEVEYIKASFAKQREEELDGLFAKIKAYSYEDDYGNSAVDLADVIREFNQIMSLGISLDEV